MKKILIPIFCALFLSLSAAEYKFEAKSNKNWKLKIGETAEFSVQLLSRENKKDPFKVLSGKKVRYLISKNDVTEKSGFFTTSDNPFTVKVKMDRPGWIQFRVNLYDDAGKKPATYKNRYGTVIQIVGGIGALVEPDKLLPGVEEPKDFDAFWNAQKVLLKKDPMKVVLTPVKVSPALGKHYNIQEVKINCPGTNPVLAYMSIPVNAKPKSLPIIVYYHAAGVRSSAISTGRQAIMFNVNAHGILNGQPREYYNKMRDTELKGYAHRGKENRDTVYFRGMFLRMLRTLEYVKSRPEWNGKTLIVTGGSMGGGQSIAAAALDPQVTLVVAGVPAIGDHGGNIAKNPRRPGWPQYYYAQTAKPEVVKATSYYDNIFFARRVKCEVFLTTGLIDRTCPPTSVYLYFKNLKSAKKDLDVFPCGEHSGGPTTKGQKRINQLLSGKK